MAVLFNFELKRIAIASDPVHMLPHGVLSFLCYYCYAVDFGW